MNYEGLSAALQLFAHPITNTERYPSGEPKFIFVAERGAADGANVWLGFFYFYPTEFVCKERQSRPCVAWNDRENLTYG